MTAFIYYLKTLDGKGKFMKIRRISGRIINLLQTKFVFQVTFSTKTLNCQISTNFNRNIKSINLRDHKFKDTVTTEHRNDPHD